MSTKCAVKRSGKEIRLTPFCFVSPLFSLFFMQISMDKVNKDSSDSVATNVGSGGGSAGRSGTVPPAVKPPYTYTELIEQALSEKGPLTVAEIYRWIS